MVRLHYQSQNDHEDRDAQNSKWPCWFLTFLDNFIETGNVHPRTGGGNKFSGKYPLVICYIAMENGDLWWIYPLKMVMFHSYVSLPEVYLVDLWNIPSGWYGLETPRLLPVASNRARWEALRIQQILRRWVSGRSMDVSPVVYSTDLGIPIWLVVSNLFLFSVIYRIVLPID